MRGWIGWMNREVGQSVSPASGSAQQALPRGTLLRLNAKQNAERFRLLPGQRPNAAQQFHDFHHTAKMIDAVPAAIQVPLQLFAPAPGHAAVQDIEERLRGETLLAGPRGCGAPQRRAI